MQYDDAHDFGNNRWAAFKGFDRQVQTDSNGIKKSVLTAYQSIVQDVLPGKYQYSQIFDFDDMSPVVPKFTKIQGVKWNKGKNGSKGTLMFPPNFDGFIETEYVTAAFAAYYSCTVTNVRSDSTVSLKMRHAIQDFTYIDSYLDEYVLNPNGNNGAGLERHDFTHLDCPKNEENGHFIIAKFVDDNETTIHITGFKIPAKHCLLIPEGVLHSNDYLKGTWRTMLSDEAPIDYVYLKNKNGPIHFKFSNDRLPNFKHMLGA